MNMRVELLTSQELGAHQSALSAFERSFSYPLGDDQRFCIDHGPRYASFFEAIGEPLFGVLSGAPLESSGAL